MAKFNYQLITLVMVEVTLEGLKNNHPDIVQRLIEKGYKESFETEEDFEDSIDDMVEEDEQLNELIFNPNTPNNPYLVYKEQELDLEDTYGYCNLSQ
jgi:hypothetical protein